MGGKKYSYTLKVTAELTAEETQVLTKYGYLAEEFHIDPEISANLKVRSDAKGPPETSIAQLQKGVEWSCDHLPTYFAAIPAALHAKIEQLLGIALARDGWMGEEVIGA